MGNLKTVIVKAGIILSIFLGVYLVTYLGFNMLGLAKEPKMLNEYKATYVELKELQTQVDTLSQQNNEEVNKKKIEDLKAEIVSLKEEIEKIKE